MSINPKRKLINCLGCGRDTTAMYGYCYRCSVSSSTNKNAQQINENKDRNMKKRDNEFRLDSDGYYDDYEEYIDLER